MHRFPIPRGVSVGRALQPCRRIHRRRRGGWEHGSVAAKGVPVPEELSPQTPTEPWPGADGPVPDPQVALGMALRARANEIAQMVLETWEAGKTESYAGDERVRQDVLRFVVSGSDQISNFLITGERPTGDQVRSQSSPGRAAANETVTLGDLTKLYLYSRDAHLGVIREEAQRLDIPPGVIALAEVAVRAGSDGALVRVAKQFDLRRHELQTQLAEEQDRLAHQAAMDAHRLRTIGALHRDVERVDFDVDAVLDWAVDKVRELVGSHGAGVGIVEGDEVVFNHVSGQPRLRTPIASSLAGLAIRQGQTMYCQDAELDPRVDREATRAAGLRSLIYVPIRHHGETVAVLGVTSPDPHAFQDLDVLTTELVGGAIAATYRHAADLASKRALLAELEETVTALRASEAKLAHQVRHDPLTGVPNRPYIIDRAEELLVRARRHGIPAAALFLDLDHFKMVNDTYGHKVGDELLYLVANQLPEVLRANDMVGRIGGDEFVVLLEGASLDAGVEEVAGRILQTVRELRLSTSDGSVVRTTVSVGIASGDRASASDLLHDADLALYQAKAAGRDRFETFVPTRAKLPG